MSISLFSKPYMDAGQMCYDYFSGSDEALEDWIGLACAEDIEVAGPILHYIGTQLPKETPLELCLTDASNETILMIHKKTWTKRPDIQAAWNEIIATPLEKLIMGADLHNDNFAIDRVQEGWINSDISYRLRQLTCASQNDLSYAFFDDVPENVIHAIIDAQIQALLS